MALLLVLLLGTGCTQDTGQKIKFPSGEEANDSTETPVSTTTTSTTVTVTTNTVTSTTLSSSTTTTLPSGSDPAGYPQISECGGEHYCRGVRTLYRQIEGRNYDVTVFDSNIGPSDPAELFRSGGSMNIPVINRAGLYSARRNEAAHREWFNRYFDTQLGASGFQGREVLSPLYAASVVASVTIVYKKSIERGHTELTARARQWLRAYYALVALTAWDTTVTQAVYQLANGPSIGNGNNGFFRGYNTANSGPRSIRGGFLQYATVAQSQFLTLALAHPQRRMSWEIWGEPIGILTIIAGLEVNNLGKSNWTSRPIPPENLGLSNADRQVILEFINNNGNQRVNDVLNLIRPYKPACDFTFIRTTEGTTSWLGTSDSAGVICNRNKGPYFASTLEANNQRLQYLRPTYQENPSEGGYAQREGQNICAYTDNNIRRCIAIAPGAPVIEFSWTTANGIQVR